MVNDAITRIIGASLVVMTSAVALAQDLGIKSPPKQAAPVAIINAAVHPVSKPSIEKGFVTFEAGVITEIGPQSDMHPGRPDEMRRSGWLVIDAAGKHVYPGLFVPYTQMGLQEISAVRATLDVNEVGGISPEARTIVAVNPDSTLIPVARTNGVLTAAVFPGPGGGGLLNYFPGSSSAIPGRAGVIRLEGWTWEEMSVVEDAGVVVNWPVMRPVQAWWMDKSEDEQRKDTAGRVQAIATAFDQATAYSQRKPAGDIGTDVPTDVRWEAMRSVLPGASPEKQKPVFFVAEDYDQIVAAVSFAVDRKLKPVIVGGLDAPLCAELLKRHDVPVIVLGTIRFPKRDDSAYDDAFTLPARLQAAGIRWCLSSGEEPAHERNLPYAAALAVAYGLDRESAIRGITLSPAEIFGVSDRLGSIENGKSATLIITSGDPLEVMSNVEQAFIDGRTIDLSNKQTKLAEKYREKYKQSAPPAR